MRSRDDYERQFRRAGLPLFIEDYSASRDVWTRVAPLLTLVFLGEMLGAIDLDWPWYANVAAALGGLAFLVGVWAVANVLRRRPALARPRDVGAFELALFVLVPALVPLVFGGQWQSALGTAASNLALLALIYGVVGYGLFSIIRWVGVRLIGELGASAVRLARAIPLILGGAVILFLTTELWQVFSDMELGSLLILAGVAAFFVVLGALAVGPDVRDAWIGTTGNELVDVPVLGDITEELLRVAGGLAALSGLSYAVQMQTDDTYRRLFLDEVEGSMRDSFRARAEYLRARHS